jgi:CheY-like chemotaxis protein
MSLSKKIEKVLIVDDDANIRLITEVSLQGLTDWQVLQAANGKEALATIQDDCPDLVLLDMMMPDTDGIALLEQIKSCRNGNEPIIIFMTAKVLTQEVERYRSLGAAGVISKPFDPMKLPEQITAIVNSPASR